MIEIRETNNRAEIYIDGELLIYSDKGIADKDRQAMVLSAKALLIDREVANCPRRGARMDN